MMEIIKNSNIDFMGKRMIAFGVSAILSLLGIICVISIATGHANLGIDFAGGASADLVFQKPVQMDQARKALDAAGLTGAEIQTLTGGTKLLVRIKEAKNIPIEQMVDRIKGAFVKGLPDNPVTIDSSAAIGPTVGKALQKDALLAIALSFLGIIIYIAWRFEFRFGLAATVATFHDVLAVLGVFFVLHREINLLVVTALLTLAGYSLTDTVVVFDRIRENLRMRPKDSLMPIINDSVNEVLSRTIVTSLTVFLTVLSLFLFGGEVLHNFAFAMMMGVIVGTYSSVFVASPLLFVWRSKKGGRLIKATMLTAQPVKASLEARPTPAPAAPAPPKEQPMPKKEKPDQAKGKGKKGGKTKAKA